MHRLVSAVGAEDGPAHMLLHLSRVQYAWSARSCLVLQRVQRPIPPLVPPLHCPLPAHHYMTRGEGGKGMSGGVWSVLEEDAVLLRWSELLHRCIEGRQEKSVHQRAVCFVHVRNSNLSRRGAAQDNAKREANRNMMYE